MRDRLSIFADGAAIGSNLQNELHLPVNRRSRSAESSKTLAQRTSVDISLAKRSDDPVLSSRMQSWKHQSSVDRLAIELKNLVDRGVMYLSLLQQAVAVQWRNLFA